MSMRLLITGGAGFIGSHLAELALLQGADVVVLDSLAANYDPALKQANLELVRLRASRAAGTFRFVRGDVRNGELLDRLFARHRFTHVAHLAALPGVRPSLAEPRRYLEANVGGTVALFEAIRRYGGPVQRVVVASSSSVYGAQPGPWREELPPAPLSPYAASKAAAEQYALTYQRLLGIGVTCLRFFTVYGPRQRPDMAIARFTARALAGQPIPVFGDVRSRRDYTEVGDVVRGTWAALQEPAEAGYQVYNLGSGRPVTLQELIAALGRVLHRPIALDLQPPAPGDAPATWADIRRAQERLGYAPRVSLEQGLARYVAWVRWNLPAGLTSPGLGRGLGRRRRPRGLEGRESGGG
ncbi:MAG TPA: NAD-dependent epimerase/dehydratase family protein [Thermaerobacter sp.]